jgi:RNA-splicing ligase RtcB
VINCHHNYVAREKHYGENVLVTRKGAVRAAIGDMGIIPGSMGARSYLVRGKVIRRVSTAAVMARAGPCRGMRHESDLRLKITSA